MGGFLGDGGGNAVGGLIGSKGGTHYSMPDLSGLHKAPAYTYYGVLSDYGSKSDNSFDRYAKAIGAPSSVDDVRRSVYDDEFKNTMGDIERTTRGRMGDDMMKSFSRGLYDPQAGADSDIARIGQAQVAAEGGRTAANAYTALAGQNLDLQKAKEQALWDALGKGYAGDLATDSQNRALRVQIEQANADAENRRRQALVNAAMGAASEYTRTYREPTPGAMEKGMSKFTEGLSGGGFMSFL